MIDSATGQRVVVMVDSEYGPYVRVLDADDGGALEDILDDDYVLYWPQTPKDFQETGAREYYFGWAVDVEKLQERIDSIGLNW